jgi:hypothetical protein
MQDEPTLPGRIVKRFGLEAWHFLAGLAFAIGVAGYAFATWDRGKATVEQLDEVKTVVTAQLGAAQGTTAVQLGTLQSQVQDLRARQAAVEGKLDIIIGLASSTFDQAKAIARETGARQVPAPALPDPSHPPLG